MGFTLLDNCRDERNTLRDSTKEDVNRAFRKIDAQWQRDDTWNEEAWALLWEFCRAKVRAQTGTSDLLEDVLPEVAGRLRLIFTQYRAHMIKEPASYIPEIVRTAVASVYRRRQRDAKKLQAFFEYLITNVYNGNSLGAEPAVTVKDVLDELKSMVERGTATTIETEMFELRFLDGFTVREVAEKVGRDKNFVVEVTNKVSERLRDAIHRKGAISEIG